MIFYDKWNGLISLNLIIHDKSFLKFFSQRFFSILYIFIFIIWHHVQKLKFSRIKIDYFLKILIELHMRNVYKKNPCKRIFEKVHKVIDKYVLYNDCNRKFDFWIFGVSEYAGKSSLTTKGRLLTAHKCARIASKTSCHTVPRPHSWNTLVFSTNLSLLSNYASQRHSQC